MNLNLIQPMRKMIMPMTFALAAASAAVMSSCSDDRTITVEPSKDVYFPPVDLPSVDSPLINQKLDSIMAVTTYKVDSVKNASGDQNVIDSLLNDAHNKINAIIDNTNNQ